MNTYINEYLDKHYNQKSANVNKFPPCLLINLWGVLVIRFTPFWKFKHLQIFQKPSEEFKSTF